MIPSGHRLERLRSDRGGEYTGLEYREYRLRRESSRNLRQRIHRSKMAFQNESGRLYGSPQSQKGNFW